MKNDIGNHFSIQYLFVFLLYLIIVLMSIMIILLGRDLYNNINDDRNDNYDLRVSLSYIANKIRQDDNENSVIINSGENPSIILKETYDGCNYETWIYHYNNSIYEIFIDEGQIFKMSDGMKIVNTESFNITKLKDNLYKFSVENNKNSAELVLSLNSFQDGEI